MELSQQLVRCRFALSEYFLAQLLAQLLLHRLNCAFVLFHRSVPRRGLVLICVERVDLAEWVEGIVYLESLALFWSEQSQKLVVLRPQFENDVDPDYYVLKVAIHEGLAFPFVATLAFPEVAGQLSDSVLPASADSHALVQLNSHV